MGIEVGTTGIASICKDPKLKRRVVNAMERAVVQAERMGVTDEEETRDMIQQARAREREKLRRDPEEGAVLSLTDWSHRLALEDNMIQAELLRSLVASPWPVAAGACLAFLLHAAHEQPAALKQLLNAEVQRGIQKRTIRQALFL